MKKKAIVLILMGLLIVGAFNLFFGMEAEIVSAGGGHCTSDQFFSQCFSTQAKNGNNNFNLYTSGSGNFSIIEADVCRNATDSWNCADPSDFLSANPEYNASYDTAWRYTTNGTFITSNPEYNSSYEYWNNQTLTSTYNSSYITSNPEYNYSYHNTWQYTQNGTTPAGLKVNGVLNTTDDLLMFQQFISHTGNQTVVSIFPNRSGDKNAISNYDTGEAVSVFKNADYYSGAHINDANENPLWCFYGATSSGQKKACMGVDNYRRFVVVGSYSSAVFAEGISTDEQLTFAGNTKGFIQTNYARSNDYMTFGTADNSYNTPLWIYTSNTLKDYDFGWGATPNAFMDTITYPELWFNDGDYVKNITRVSQYGPTFMVNNTAGDINISATGEIYFQNGTNTYTFADFLGGGGSSTFTGLTDTPGSYSGEGSNYLRVNNTETGLEFIDASTLAGTLDINDLTGQLDLEDLSDVGTMGDGVLYHDGTNMESELGGDQEILYLDSSGHPQFDGNFQYDDGTQTLGSTSDLNGEFNSLTADGLQVDNDANVDGTLTVDTLTNTYSDPKAITFQAATREEVSEAMSKRLLYDGKTATVFFNTDTNYLEIYREDEGKFYDMDGNLLHSLSRPVPRNLEYETYYTFNPFTGEVEQKKQYIYPYRLQDGTRLNRTDGTFYDANTGETLSQDDAVISPGPGVG